MSRLRSTATGPGELSVEEAVRAARVDARRRQLLRAAVAVMGRTGFHQMSMQALAGEADVSVGLIYKYFGSKDKILLAMITTILDAFTDQLQPAIDSAGDDPVAQFAAGMRRYIEIVDANLDAVMLTYRESRKLDQAGRDLLKDREVASSEPLRAVLRHGIAAGRFTDVDVDLVVYDVMMIAHAWALKQWHFAGRYTLDEYIEAQVGLVMGAVSAKRR